MHKASIIALAALLVWLSGFFYFDALVPAGVFDTTTRTDAVVVLTGGQDRVATGIRLLDQDLGKRLFISGVYESSMLPEIVNLTELAGRDLSCCIDLGYQAHNTRQNATEVSDWVRLKNYSSIRLVTSSYHMPRALVEVRHALPEALIIPHPVFVEGVDPRHWWSSFATFRLMLSEYSKYLVISLGV